MEKSRSEESKDFLFPKKRGFQQPPGWKSFRFGEVEIDSNFDSGNLGDVELGTSTLFRDPQTNNIVSLPTFNIKVQDDCVEHSCTNPGMSRGWFYFKFRGLDKGQKVCFNFTNLTVKPRLFAEWNYKPLFKVDGGSGAFTEWRVVDFVTVIPVELFRQQQGVVEFGNAEDSESDFSNQSDPQPKSFRAAKSNRRKKGKKFKQRPAEDYSITTQDKGLKPRSEYVLRLVLNVIQSNKTFWTSVAFSEPFGYNTLLQKLEEVQKKVLFEPDIQFHRELLIYSSEGRRVEMLTITGTPPDVNFSALKRYPKVEGLFPECFYENNRPFKFGQNEKKLGVIFITARVHPGEVPSSHSIDAILDFLTSAKDMQAQTLLQNFVFVLIPMLNPDGVARGHYRLDARSQNLNRFFDKPDNKFQPEVFAIKKLLKEQFYGQEKLFMFLDLHATTGHRSNFLYGNHFDYLAHQVQALMLPKLLSMNSLHFDFEACNFKQNLMHTVDYRNPSLSKKGSARVALYYDHPYLLQCYTLECSYAAGKPLFQLIPRFSTRHQRELEETDPVQDVYSFVYQQERNISQYSKPIFRDVGRALLVSLLDLIQLNPKSRLYFSKYQGSLNKMGEDLTGYLQRDPQGSWFKNTQAAIRLRTLSKTKKKVSKKHFSRKELFLQPSESSLGGETSSKATSVFDSSKNEQIQRSKSVNKQLNSPQKGNLDRKLDKLELLRRDPFLYQLWKQKDVLSAIDGHSGQEEESLWLDPEAGNLQMQQIILKINEKERADLKAMLKL